MRARLLADSSSFSLAGLVQMAQEMGLDGTGFRSCLEAGRYAALVKQDREEAQAAGVTSTPTFVLGTQTGDKVTGVVIVGAPPYPVFDREIKKRLAKLK